MNIIVTKEMNSVIADSLVGLVREVATNTLVIAMSVVVVRRRVCGVVQILGGIGIVLAIEWEWPELGLSSCSSHHL